ncbi:MAG: hypothetical protein NTZ09_01250 [Candidatus Hydrogenedentes bacterium]|nr:hypothetical protein [Candidatus Hydrogenedentota bacterium]
MKKVAAGCFAVVCVLGVLVALLAGVGHLREERQRDLPPITLQDLDQIAASMQNPSEAAAGAASPAVENATKSNPEQKTAANLPRRLERAATDEERRQFFMRGKSTSDKIFGFVATSPVGAIGDAVAVAAGIPAGASWERGMANLFMGRWAEARRYLEEVLRKWESRVVQEQACGYLAWLEDDPELAARYMEVASSGGQLFGLSSSATLARATGSTELAEHYQSLYDKARVAKSGGPRK